jgi:hypothetical protein
MKTRTEMFKNTPCLVITLDNNREHWVSVGKVKAVLAIGAMAAQAWVESVSPKPTPTAEDLSKLSKEELAQRLAATLAQNATSKAPGNGGVSSFRPTRFSAAAA